VEKIDAYRNADEKLGDTITGVNYIWRNAVDHIALIVALWKCDHFRADVIKDIKDAITNFEGKLEAVDKGFSGMFKTSKAAGEPAKLNQLKYMFGYKGLSKKVEDLNKAEKNLDHYRKLQLLPDGKQNEVRELAAKLAKHNMNILPRKQAPSKIGHVPEKLLPKSGARLLLEAPPASTQPTATIKKPFSRHNSRSPSAPSTSTTYGYNQSLGEYPRSQTTLPTRHGDGFVRDTYGHKTIDPWLTCLTCKRTFESREYLFKHLLAQEERGDGHAKDIRTCRPERFDPKIFIFAR